MDRRDFLKGTAATGVFTQAGGSFAASAEPRRERRIATEEAWSTAAHMRAMDELAALPSDNLDLISRRGVPTDGPLYRALIDDEERLRQMDELGIDMHVLSLTSPGVQMLPADRAIALAEQTNDRMAETVARNPYRFAGLASFAPQDPVAAAREMERAVARLGLHGFVVNSHTDNRYLDEPFFWPILEAAEALDRPIYIHPRAPADTMAGPFREHNMHAAIWGFQAETGTHAMRLILSGVFDRFPRLQIVLGHMGESIPFNLWRADYQFERRRERQRSSLVPSEVFRRNFTITTSGVEHDPTLRYCIEVLGADRIMWAIDYPYQPMAGALEAMNQARISDSDRALIFHRNAERLFHIPPL